MTTPRQIELLQHTLGLRPDMRVSYRNHFVAGQGHHDMPDLEALEALGLMTRRPAPKFCEPNDIVFHATDNGKILALARLQPPPTRTRYDEWLSADCNESFGEFICPRPLPKFDFARDGQKWKYRMYRRSVWGERDVQGEWAATKKAAKAIYKVALKARNKEQSQ